jgi:hypothetical protein
MDMRKDNHTNSFEVQLVHHFIEGTDIDTTDTTIVVLLMYITAQ